MKEEVILEKVDKLIFMYKQGLLGGQVMPEDCNPKLPKESLENYNYFTLPMALNYQRNSYTLWEAANKTFNDKETDFVFNTKLVSDKTTEELQIALTKYKVALQKNKQIEIWKRICISINKMFDGDVRELFKVNDYDINKIKYFIQKEHKSEFPYLSGEKICNYWLYVMYQYTNVKCKNIECLTIAPDTHIIKASNKLGIINDSEVNSSNVQQIVAQRWDRLLENTIYKPINMHTPLWLWSRNGFINIE